MTDLEKRVSELVIEKFTDRPDLFIIAIKMHENGKLTILLDGDQGISIQDCAAVSRHVGFHLEEENQIDTAYHLEVSSPGIESPLLLLRQYQKNISRNVHIKLVDGGQMEGKLLAADDQEIEIEELIKEKGKKVTAAIRTLPFTQIAETKVLISFK
ncbi:ribosome maturation factor RimP [bacterium A37T11]|nr:ribosome maturation factor RimP [bacterium A37T11]